MAGAAARSGGETACREISIAYRHNNGNMSVISVCINKRNGIRHGSQWPCGRRKRNKAIMKTTSIGKRRNGEAACGEK